MLEFLTSIEGCLAVDARAPAERARMRANRVAPRRSAPPDDGVVRIARERRRASSVSLIFGLTTAELDEVAALLKRHCGTGGTAKNGVVEIQGDHREKIAQWFEQRGRKVKLAGG
jgi:translation initiation factor 1